MALTITPQKGTPSLDIYSISGGQPNALVLNVATKGGGAGVRNVVWTLTDSSGKSVQQPAPQQLPVDPVGGVVVVPIFATASGKLTLTLTDFADTKSSGTLQINSTLLNSFTVASSTATPKIGQPVAYTATILDATNNKPAGIRVSWNSDSNDDVTLIPISSRRGEPSIAGQDSTMTTTNVLESQLTTPNRLVVTASLGTNGPAKSIATQFGNILRAPTSMLPLLNNVIDDAVIDAVLVNNPLGSLPFLIPQIQNYQGKSYLVLTGNGVVLGMSSISDIGTATFPWMMYAAIEGGAFDFTGPMQITYTVFNKGIKSGTSDPLNVQVKRNNFPQTSQFDPNLPRPIVSLSSYTKADYDKSTKLQVTIPLRLDPTKPIFAINDVVTISIVLTGYTSNNEGQVLRRPVGASGKKTLTGTDLKPPASQLMFDIPYSEFKSIDGSIGSVTYTVTRTDPTTGLKITHTSPSQAMVVDTVDAFSASSVFHFSHIAALISQL